MNKKVLACLSLFAFWSFAGYQTARAEAPAVAEARMPSSLFNAQAKEPDIKGIAVLQSMIDGGAKLHYMGERSGMHGWLIVKGGQIQMVYLAPDRQSIIIGALFTDKGDLVTPSQISVVADRDKEVAAIMSGSASDYAQVIRAGGIEGGVASVSAGDKADADKVKSPLPVMAASPGERLFQDLRASANVELGKATAPELVMVMSSSCTKCKKIWEELRTSVHEGSLRVRLVPITLTGGGEDLRAAAVLLKSNDPMSAWEKHVAGDAAALAGEPDAVATKAILSNRTTIDRWNILGTPYFVYRGKDKAIKIVQGRPERMAAILADIVP